MPHPPLSGELAALSVSLLWSVGTLLFAWSTRRIGADRTNLFRITIAWAVLGSFLTLGQGLPYPLWAAPAQLAWLSLSGLLGLLVGDGLYFRSLALLGPRRSSLLAALAPALTALLGFAFLGERLGARALAGMALTLLGTAWVVIERAPDGSRIERPLAGALYGLGAALGQASGLVVAKGAMHGLDALATASARMTAAAAALWLLALLHRRRLGLGEALRTPGLAPRIVTAALVGPVLGVWLSLYAAARIPAAIAATLMALVPIVILPLVYFVHGERLSPRSIVGALVAVGGVALLVTR